MHGVFFKKQKTFQSPLTEDEIFDRLSKHMLGGSPDKKRIIEFFKGKLDRENHSFVLLQTFDMGYNNQIRPEIRGKIESKNRQSIIYLDIRLPKSDETLFDIILVLNILIMIGIAFLPIPESIPKKTFLIGIPLAIVISVLMGKFFFNLKYSDCEKLIKRIMMAN